MIGKTRFEGFGIRIAIQAAIVERISIGFSMKVLRTRPKVLVYLGQESPAKLPDLKRDIQD